MTDSISRRLPIPRNWLQGIKAAVLHVIALVRLAVVHARKPVATSAAVRGTLDLEGALHEIALLREGIGFKDTRMAVIDPHWRPCYRATERTTILELRAARGGLNLRRQDDSS